MIEYAKVVDGVIVQFGLPRSGTFSGLPVSNYHRLSAENLAEEGWFPVVDDGPPDYDPSTDRVSRDVQVVDGSPVAVYTVEPVPAGVNPDTSDHFDPQIGAPDA